MEKEESRHQRKELYEQRKAQLFQVAKLESQMATVQMVPLLPIPPLPFISMLFLLQYVEWNDHDQLLCKYIKTKATPPIFYLPTEHTPQSATLLRDTKQQIESRPLFLCVPCVCTHTHTHPHNACLHPHLCLHPVSCYVCVCVCVCAPIREGKSLLLCLILCLPL